MIKQIQSFLVGTFLIIGLFSLVAAPLALCWIAAQIVDSAEVQTCDDSFRIICKGGPHD